MTTRCLNSIKARKNISVLNYEKFFEFTLNKDEEIYFHEDGFGLTVRVCMDVEKVFGISLYDNDDEDHEDDYAEVFANIRFSRCLGEADHLELLFEYYDNSNDPFSTRDNFEKKVIIDKSFKYMTHFRFISEFKKVYNDWPERLCKDVFKRSMHK